MAGAPPGARNRSNNKPWEGALLRAVLADDGKRLRSIAETVVRLAIEGDMAAVREVGDRLDGKPKQVVVGGDENDSPLAIAIIERVIVRPQTTD